jgi:hypothetical protein
MPPAAAKISLFDRFDLKANAIGSSSAHDRRYLAISLKQIVSVFAVITVERLANLIFGYSQFFDSQFWVWEKILPIVLNCAIAISYRFLAS